MYIYVKFKAKRNGEKIMADYKKLADLLYPEATLTIEEIEK